MNRRTHYCVATAILCYEHSSPQPAARSCAALFVPVALSIPLAALLSQYHLSQHPEAEARVCQELGGLGLLAAPGAPPPRPVSIDDLSKLPFLSACIKVCGVGLTLVEQVGASLEGRVFLRCSLAPSALYTPILHPARFCPVKCPKQNFPAAASAASAACCTCICVRWSCVHACRTLLPWASCLC